MDLQEKIEALEKEFNEKIEILKSEAQQEDEFPKVGEYYFHIGDTGDIYRTEYAPPYNDDDYECRESIGNIFKNRDEACFAVEKLKVEEELRKFSRPFKHGAKNHTINYNHETEMVVNVNATATYQETGSFYFDSYEEVVEAIESIGEERIKKYIFGVED